MLAVAHLVDVGDLRHEVAEEVVRPLEHTQQVHRLARVCVPDVVRQALGAVVYEARRDEDARAVLLPPEPGARGRDASSAVRHAPSPQRHRSCHETHPVVSGHEEQLWVEGRSVLDEQGLVAR